MLESGFTLIELTVVLLVLIGLAGLAIPFVSGYVGKTHNSTGGISGAETFSALSAYQLTQGGYPNNLDLLADATGKIDLTLDDTYAGTASFTLNSDGTYAATQNATFDVGTAAAATSGAGAVKGYVTDLGASATPATNTIANALGYTLNAGHELIVLGINQGNSAIGKTLAQAPVHFGDKATLQPQLVYSRFLAVFDVDSANGTAPAKLVGIVHGPSSSDGIEGISANIKGYYGG